MINQKKGNVKKVEAKKMNIRLNPFIQMFLNIGKNTETMINSRRNEKRGKILYRMILNLESGIENRYSNALSFFSGWKMVKPETSG